MIDISMSITETMQVYKNDKSSKPKLVATATHDKNGVHTTTLTIGLHTGTHMDAPLHMIENGKMVKDTDIEKLISPCKVLDMTAITGGIEEAHLRDKGIKKDDFILLKTKNSYSDKFEFDFVYVAESGAKYLSNIGIKGVGIDSLGIERAQPRHETHKTILGNDIPILEGLRLKHVEAGEYVLVALPIKIPEAEAAPVRAVLLHKDTLNF